MATINLLGELTAHVGERQVDLGPARQRCVLAALAVDAGRVVAVDRLIDRVWAPDVPRRARATLHSYVSRLRHALVGIAIARRSGGYVLAGDTDLQRFRDLHARARGGVGDTQTTLLLTEALGLWRGEALTGLDSEWAREERDRLHQERLAAERDLVDVRLRVGEGAELLVELATSAGTHPLDERVAGQYMLALFRAGRAADALAHYRELRERLVEELGTEPGVPLQELHRRILSADATLIRVPSGVEPVAVPRQLPPVPAPFVGRRDELALLDAVAQDVTATVVISAVVGPGGIGKTWLALQWAHRCAERFPDGQLFVDLRGFSPDGPPMTAGTVLRGFLEALGVEPTRLPLDLHARAALFRSLVVGKRMLLVLDNAADTGQVIPLLPGSDTCTVVVTSRDRLPGLITGYGARHVLVDVLSDAEARVLLTMRLGVARVNAEPVAVAELIALCGGFPLALSIVASHASTRPYLPLAGFAAELRDLGLGALESDDPTASLPTVLSWSQRAMAPDQVRMFALLGIAPGPHIGLPAAASLAGRPVDETRTVLRGLEQASLIVRAADSRYRMHELIRRHAIHTAHRHLPDAERDEALRRVVDFYLHTANTGDRFLFTHCTPIQLAPPARGCQPQPLPDAAAAVAWFEHEHPCLLAAQQTASTLGWHQEVWQLACGLNAFHDRRGHLHQNLAVWRAALAAANLLDVRATGILVRRRLGRVLTRMHRNDEALTHLRQALTWSEHVHDETSQGCVHYTLSQVWAQQGDDRRALEHCTQALDLFRAVGDLVWETHLLNQVGLLTAQLGDHDKAVRHCRTALIVQRRDRDRDGEAWTLDSLGYIEHHRGHPARAVGYYRQALAVWRELGDTYQAANTLDGLGRPYAALGRHDRAFAVWQEALRLYRTQNRPHDARRVQRQLAELVS